MPEPSLSEFESTWLQAYPNLDPEPLIILGRVSRLAGILEKNAQDLRDGFGLIRGEIEILAALRRALPDFTATPTDLSKLTLVTTAATTNRLNSLEAKSLIKRQIDAQSRRRILVSLTGEGKEAIEAYMEAFVSLQAQVTSQLSTQEILSYSEMLQKLIQLSQDHQQTTSNL